VSADHPHFCDCLDCMGGIPAEQTKLSPTPLAALSAVARAEHLRLKNASVARRRARLAAFRRLPNPGAAS
jgi:hypothetical protein